MLSDELRLECDSADSVETGATEITEEVFVELPESSEELESVLGACEAELVSRACNLGRKETVKAIG